ncbi:four helix bundle protein [soil metagenome]
MGFNFEKLNVWKLAVEFADEVHIMTRKFPKEEMYSLSSQVRRATDSISLNIAEGATGNSTAEFKRFLGFSSRSCAEVITCLYHAQKRKYIDDNEFKRHYDNVETIFRMINKLKNTI